MTDHDHSPSATIVELLSREDSPSSLVLDSLPSDYNRPDYGAYTRLRWWHLADRATARGRLRRRSYPIRSYVGPNGSGKSWVMVMDAVPSLLARRFVLSTVRLLDFEDPRPCPGGLACDDPDGHWLLATVSVPDPRTPNAVVRMRYRTGAVHQAAHPYYIPLRSYQQLLDAVDCDVLLDEVTGVASSRESSSMPVQISNLLVQLRRRNIVLCWSTPSWGRADKIMREVTQAVTLTSARMPTPHPYDGQGAPRLWTDKRVIIARTYDPSQMDEFEAHRADQIPHEVRSIYWRPSSVTDTAYSTADAVTALGWANEAGLCMTCGGKRTIPGCSCPDHLARKKGLPVPGSPAPALPSDKPRFPDVIAS